MTTKNKATMSKQSTIEKYKYFLNTCAREIGKKYFSVNKLVEQIKGSKSIFYYAVELKYFTRTGRKGRGYTYKCEVESFTDEDIEFILDTISKKVYKTKVEKRSLAEKTTPINSLNESNRKVNVYLHEATDIEILNELKFRGYNGSLSINKTISI